MGKNKHIVTDHAIVRYINRVLGLSDEDIMQMFNLSEKPSNDQERLDYVWRLGYKRDDFNKRILGKFTEDYVKTLKKGRIHCSEGHTLILTDGVVVTIIPNKK